MLGQFAVCLGSDFVIQLRGRAARAALHTVPDARAAERPSRDAVSRFVMRTHGLHWDLLQAVSYLSRTRVSSRWLCIVGVPAAIADAVRELLELAHPGFEAPPAKEPSDATQHPAAPAASAEEPPFSPAPAPSIERTAIACRRLTALLSLLLRTAPDETAACLASTVGAAALLRAGVVLPLLVSAAATLDDRIVATDTIVAVRCAACVHPRSQADPAPPTAGA